MKVIKKAKSIFLLGSFALALNFVIGCGGGVSEQEMTQLNSLRQEVSSLDKDAASLRDQRTQLDNQIAEKNQQLEDCAKQKQETQANLQKLGNN